MGKRAGEELIIGHKKELEVLYRIIRSGRVHHAFIFSGPEGIGKRTIARWFSAALNCDSQTEKPCGYCRSCRILIHSSSSIPLVLQYRDILSPFALPRKHILNALYHSSFMEDQELCERNYIAACSVLKASEILKEVKFGGGKDPIDVFYFDDQKILSSMKTINQDFIQKTAEDLSLTDNLASRLLLYLFNDTGTYFYHNSIKIGLIREQLIKSLGFSAGTGKRNVAIIDQAEKMTVEAQNALLKTLEEPPGASTIILITSNYYQLLPTIRSRCFHLRFSQIPPEILIEFIIEHRLLSPNEASTFASYCSGSILKALTLELKEIVSLRGRFLELFQQFSNGDLSNLIAFSEIMSKSTKTADESYQNMDIPLSCLLNLLRDLWLIKTGKSEMVINKDIYEDLVKLTKLFNFDLLDNAIKLMLSFETALTYNVNTSLAVDALGIQLWELFNEHLAIKSLQRDKGN